MWINVKDKLPDLKKFKDGDLINKRYKKILETHFAFDEKKDINYDNIFGLNIYEESEPVLVKFKTYALDDDKFRIGIGILTKYQYAVVLENCDKNGNEIRGMVINQPEITNEFLVYCSEWEDGAAFASIDEEEEYTETIVYEWMHLPKI